MGLRGSSRYKVDLPKQQALCDANYVRLCKLMHDLDERDHWVFAVSDDTGIREVCIDVIERNKYTTTILLTHGNQVALSRWAEPELRVRLYHDARMAEVIAWQRHRHLKVRYEYPNPDLYQCDEKAQINVFLSEWLVHCLSCGHVLENVVPR